MRKLLSPKKCSCSYKKEAERDEHEKAKEETKAKKEKEEDSSTNETFMSIIKYELASATEVIRWSTLPYASFGAPYQTMGITHFGQAQAYPSDEEYCRQMLTLLSFIAAQTRLLLYDLR